MRIYFQDDEVFTEITIKGAYDELPAIKYPLITVLEINNTDNTLYDDKDGENISDLGYQFDCMSGNREDMLATKSAMLMSKKVDDFIRNYDNGKYKAMRRTGRSAVLPLVNDNTKINSSTTYECSLDIKRNIIYKLS